MRTFFLTTGRAATLPLAVLATFSMAACGGGGESPRQAMTLSQVSLTCQQQPGETCTKMQANVMLSADVTDQRPLWEEKPAGASKIFDKVKPVKQADGSWVMVFSVKPGLSEGTYSGTVDFSVFVSPFPGTPNYQPRTASYSVTVASMKGKLSALQALPDAGDWQGSNGNAAHTGQVPVTLDAARFTRRWTWQDGAATLYTRASAVVAANGLVYLSLEDAVDDPADGTSKFISVNRLTALSEHDSSIAWTSEQRHPSGLGAPGVSGKRIVMMDTQTAYGYDAISGARLAPVKQANSNGLLTELSRHTPPTLFDGYAYVGGNNDVISLDATTAANRWSGSLRLPVLSYATEWAPAVNASTVYVNVAGKLAAYERANGTLRFSVAVPGQGEGSLSKYALRQVPVLVDENTVLLINQLPEAGKAADNSLTLVDAGKRSVRWTVNGKFTTQPVVANGIAYVGNDSGKVLEARSLQDGAVLWTWPLADVEESGFGGNLIVTNNVLFVAGRDGTHALDLNSHKAVWSYRLGGMLSLSRNGVLYIRSYVDGSNKLAYLTAINLQ